MMSCDQSSVRQSQSLIIDEEGTDLYALVSSFDNSDSICGMEVNGRAQSLSQRIYQRCTIDATPIYIDSPEGEAMRRRSLVFLMSMAVHRMDPSLATWHVLHQLDNGYFCAFSDREPIDDDFLLRLKAEMDTIVSEARPITFTKLFYRDALERFQELGLDYTLRLLEQKNLYEVNVNVCEGFTQIAHRILVDNTRHLSDFDLRRCGHGWSVEFTFSRWGEFYQPEAMSDERVVLINERRLQFNRRIGVECVGDINARILSGEVEDFIQLNNAFQDKDMSTLVRNILREKKRVILIAGPSASGKTTFAHRLQHLLKCRNAKSYIVTIDNYYLPREESPRDPVTGEFDFECLEALRLDRLNQDLMGLLQGDAVWLPEFDFKSGLPIENSSQLQIEDDAMLIMEGIHCLNNGLTTLIPNEWKFRIFIAPFTPVNLDDRNYISNKVIRLLRRMVRDKMHRSYGCAKTISRWGSVMKGEHKFLFPFMKDADYIFNSALDYEINVLKPYAILQLKTVRPMDPEYAMAMELLEFLQHFEMLPYKYVPRDSLLQEFLEGHWLN